MAQKEETVSPGWTTSFFIQTREDVSRVVADTTAAIVVHSQSPRPYVVFQSKDENSGNQLQKLQSQFSKVFKGFSHPTETKRIAYNPEVFTSQKHQWARFQLQSLDQKSFKEPTRLFESIAVVGIHPNCDSEALQKLIFARKPKGSGKFCSALIF